VTRCDLPNLEELQVIVNAIAGQRIKHVLHKVTLARR